MGSPPLDVSAIVPDDAAVLNMDNAVSMLGRRRLVSYKHDGMPFIVQLLDYLHDDLPRLGIEVAGRLVGENNAGPRNQSPGNRHALLFAAGKLARLMISPMRQTDRGHRFLRQTVPGRRRDVRIYQRQLNVIKHGCLRKQVESLKNEPELLIADLRYFLFGIVSHRLAFEEIVAGSVIIKETQDLQQGRLARAGRPHNRDEFARLHGKAYAVENRRLDFPVPVHLGQIVDFNERHGLFFFSKDNDLVSFGNPFDDFNIAVGALQAGLDRDLDDFFALQDLDELLAVFSDNGPLRNS